MLLTRVLGGIALALTAVGCASPVQYTYPTSTGAFQSTGINQDGAYVYRLQPGDVLDIKFYLNDRLSDQIPIRPDGRISLQLVGDVRAAGLTPPELEQKLKELYAPLQKNIELAVVVLEFHSQKIYVGGEVLSPGTVETFGMHTPVHAIMAAGGVKNTAGLDTVVLLRNVPGDRPIYMTFNLADALTGNPDAQLVYLQPYDIVFVPKSKISNMNDFVDQYIKKMLPFTLDVGFSWVDNLTF